MTGRHEYKDIVDYYAKRARDYDEQKSKTWHSATGFQRDLINEIVRYAAQTSGPIIEFGVGTGRVASVIIQQLGRTIVGVDISREMLQVAKTKAEEGNYADRIILMQGDIEKLPFVDGAFGCGLVVSVYHYLVREREAASEFRRVLRKGAKFIIGDLIVDERDSRYFFDRLEKMASPVHHRYYHLDERKSIFEEAGFRHISDKVFSYKKEFASIAEDKSKYFPNVSTSEFRKMVLNAPDEIKRIYQIGSEDMMLYYGVSVFGC